jgi:hypothetical protein
MPQRNSVAYTEDQVHLGVTLEGLRQAIESNSHETNLLTQHQQ